MSWMEFLVGLADKLAWPVVAVVGVLVLRAPLTQLIPLLKTLKFRELEFQFGQELKTVAKRAESAFPELKQDRKSLLIAMADKMPNAAILESWKIVDEVAEKLILAQNSQIDLNVPSRYKLMQTTLVNKGIIDTKKSKLFNELRQLRNKVAHASNYEVGKAEAIQYIELCFRLVEYLTGLHHTQPLVSKLEKVS